MSEKEVLQRLKRGDEQAYLEVYDLYHKQLFSFAFSYLKSQELAKDAVQDIFIKLWENRNSINTSVKGFLFTSMKHHVINMINKNKRKILRNVQIERQSAKEHNETENVILYSEYQKILQEGLCELPDGKREIFELKTNYSLSNQEIADKLGITVHTVKSQYYQGSKFIKEYLEKHAHIKLGS